MSVFISDSVNSISLVLGSISDDDISIFDLVLFIIKLVDIISDVKLSGFDILESNYVVFSIPKI